VQPKAKVPKDNKVDTTEILKTECGCENIHKSTEDVDREVFIQAIKELRDAVKGDD
jgi:hypothetical protein